MQEKGISCTDADDSGVRMAVGMPDQVEHDGTSRAVYDGSCQEIGRGWHDGTSRGGRA